VSVRAAFPWLVRGVLGGIFAYAALGKLADPAGFAREIANYQFLPDYAQHVAVALPATELLAALVLFAPDRAWRRAGALAIAALLVVLLAAVTSVVLRGINVDCGCFGAGSGEVTWLTVLRNAALLAAAIYLVRLPDSSGESVGGAAGGVADGDGDDVAEAGRPARSRVDP